MQSARYLQRSSHTPAAVVDHKQVSADTDGPARRHKHGSVLKGGRAEGGCENSVDDGRPKLSSCNAFCFFLRAKAAASACVNALNTKQQWPQSARLKRPANVYTRFSQDFIANNSANYDNVRSAVAAVAAQWKRMNDSQKAPRRKLAGDAKKQYHAKNSAGEPGNCKSAVARAKASVATAKRRAAKPGLQGAAAALRTKSTTTAAKSKT